MKPLFTLFLLLSTLLPTLAQTPPERLAVTFGILQGGGSLVGVDAEFLVTDRVGLQAGAGFEVPPIHRTTEGEIIIDSKKRISQS